MPISAVVDASVLVSAFLFPESVPGRVLKVARQGRFVLHLSPLLLDETRFALLSTRLRDSYGHGD
jgi:predicted nucleic acid-binding protein